MVEESSRLSRESGSEGKRKKERERDREGEREAEREGKRERESFSILYIHKLPIDRPRGCYVKIFDSLANHLFINSMITQLAG